MAGFEHQPFQLIPGRGIVNTVNAQTFYVAGMSCDHCVRAVTEEVSKLPGVERVDVDLATGAVAVTGDRLLGDAEVASAVEEAGYDLVEAR